MMQPYSNDSQFHMHGNQEFNHLHQQWMPPNQNFDYHHHHQPYQMQNQHNMVSQMNNPRQKGVPGWIRDELKKIIDDKDKKQKTEEEEKDTSQKKDAEEEEETNLTEEEILDLKHWCTRRLLAEVLIETTRDEIFKISTNSYNIAGICSHS